MLSRFFNGGAAFENDVHSPKNFIKVIERERSRADRTGREFSILIIQNGAVKKNGHILINLGTCLQEILRVSDEIGSFDKGRLAVMLPDTPYQGARRALQKIEDKISLKNFKVDIITYPEHWEIKNGKNSGGGAGKEEKELEEMQPFEQWACSNEMLVSGLGTGLPARVPMWKRAVDVLGALCGLFLLMPVFTLLTFYIKKVSPGPVLFKQKRVGYLGKTFYCWKFRTMHVNAGTSSHSSYLKELIKSDKAMIKLDDVDDRIIPYGNFIRKSGLDELPQLVNVLRGEMSLIGPRPCIPYEAQEYEVWQRKRFNAIPGITGLWQVSGKNKTTFNQMIRYDISYSVKKNLFMDFGILLKTIPVVVGQVSEKVQGRLFN